MRRIYEPLNIGAVTIPNRVARTGHGTGFGGGTMSETLVEYHLARARGGVGLTILEALGVHTAAYPFLVSKAPGLVEGYQKLMDGCRIYGMRVFQQIGHLGNEIPEADGSPPLSSSDTVGALVGIQSRAMTLQQIDELVACYVEAALDCVSGGLDGIELHMAHGYLVQQFMSPLYNFRDDDYGGSFENRLRLPLRLLREVKAVLPPTMALGVRLSPELLPGGMEPQDILQIANLFEQEGLIDFLNLTVGTDYNAHRVIGAMHEPSGYELPYAKPVSPGVSVPVIVTGRFRTLEEAEQVLADGTADVVSMARAHIADPDIVRKTREGRVEEVRPCIGCNHGCIGGLLTRGVMGCTVNPVVGLEASHGDDKLEVAPVRKRVLVVGGGPAGLSAARTAALRGHEVILAEASQNLGGSVNIAMQAPRRISIGDITEWLEREVYRLNVDVRLSSYMQRDDVALLNPDAVVVATGSFPRLDGRQYLSPGENARGMEGSCVMSSHDVLMGGKRQWGSRAVVYDDTGHYEAIAAAEFLIAQGVAVDFVTGQSQFASALEPSLSAEPALERLAKGEFRLFTSAKLISVENGCAEIGYRYGGEPMSLPCQHVVFVSHNMCNRDLADELKDWGGEVSLVGDALSPRYLQTAIAEGWRAALTL